jgi:Bacterial extracellular solute-binding proteins, family 5 Middle.
MPNGNSGSDRKPLSTTKSRRRLLQILGAGTAAGLAGCTGGGGDGDDGGDGEDTTTANTTTDDGVPRQPMGDFVEFSTSPLSSLYLPEQNDAGSNARTSLLHDGSYAITVDNEVFPYFFDIEDSGDGAVFVCTLRDGIEFGTDADGNSYGQMTAEDWVFQSNMVHGVADDAADFWNEETPPTAQRGDYAVIDNVEETGELEFQVELVDDSTPDPLFPLRPVLWSASVLPKALFEQYAPDAQALREAPEIRNFTWYGNTGPYTFEDRTPGDTGSFTAARNEDYYMRNHVESSNVMEVDEAWANAPYFERYQFDNEAEQSTVLERFRNGEGDVYGLPTDNVGEFRQAVPDVRVEESLQPFLSMMFFNQRSNGHPLVKSQAGRRAIAGVIDKEVISEQIQRGLTNPAVTYQPEWSQYYDEDAVNEYGVGVSEEDVQQARDELRSLSDFSLEGSGDDVTLFGPDGEQASPTLYFDQGSTTGEDIAIQMQSDLERIGVSLQIEGRQNLLSEDFSSEPLPDENPEDFEYGPIVRNAGPPERTRTVSDWDMLIGIAGNTYPRTPGNTEVFWVRDSAVNAYGYVPEADHRALYDEATSALDQEARNEAFQEIFANLTVELPANFLSTSPDYIGVRQDINTTDLYNQYGASFYQVNRYRQS